MVAWGRQTQCPSLRDQPAADWTAAGEHQSSALVVLMKAMLLLHSSTQTRPRQALSGAGTSPSRGVVFSLYLCHCRTLMENSFVVFLTLS